MKDMQKATHLLCLLAFVLSLGSCMRTKPAAEQVKLGYLLNMTHAIPILGIESGRFTVPGVAQSLPAKLSAARLASPEGVYPKFAFANEDEHNAADGGLLVSSQYFVAGGYLVNSLITGNIDIAYLGPGPWLNAVSRGVDLVVLGLASSGANSLVFSPDLINRYKHQLRKLDPSQRQAYLLSKTSKLGVPQFGNSQDLFARMLSDHLDYIAINPAEMEAAFFSKSIDAALVSEPWGTLLEERFASEFEIEPTLLTTVNQYPAALLVTQRDFFNKHPDLIKKFLAKQQEILVDLQQDPVSSVALIKQHFDNISKKDLSEDFVRESFAKVDFNSTLDLQQLEELVKVSRQAKYLRGDVDLAKQIL